MTDVNTKTEITNALALKVNSTDMTSALALKAPILSPVFTNRITVNDVSNSDASLEMVSGTNGSCYIDFTKSGTDMLGRILYNNQYCFSKYFHCRRSSCTYR